MNKNYGSLLLRAFTLAFFIGMAALLGELVFAYGMGLFGHPVSFTSFFALCMFSGLSGFAPTWPSPSWLSPKPVNLWGRILLFIEFTLFVIVSILASSKWMAHEHVSPPIDLAFAAYAYVLIFLVMLVANFGRLKREISAS